jgi:hypothetical protein
MNKIRADRRIGLLLGGILLLAVLSIGATVALPASDKTVATKQHKLNAQELRGKKLFKSEGFATADFDDPSLSKAFRADPDSQPAGMPSFAYLSKDARDAIAAYLRARK